jgi:hypothetical protein
MKSTSCWVPGTVGPTGLTDIDFRVPMDLRHLGATRKCLCLLLDNALTGMRSSTCPESKHCQPETATIFITVCYLAQIAQQPEPIRRKRCIELPRSCPKERTPDAGNLLMCRQQFKTNRLISYQQVCDLLLKTLDAWSDFRRI